MGRRAGIVGATLTGLAVVAMIVGVVAFPVAPTSRFQRIAVSGGSGAVTFDAAGDYVAYYESGATVGDQPEKVTAARVPLIPVQLINQATGRPLALDTPYGDRPDRRPAKLHYDYQGRGALAMWQFHVDQAGRYRVKLGAANPAADSDAVVAFGPSTANALTGGLIVISGGIALTAGLITLVVGLVARRRARRASTVSA